MARRAGERRGGVNIIPTAPGAGEERDEAWEGCWTGRSAPVEVGKMWLHVEGPTRMLEEPWCGAGPGAGLWLSSCFFFPLLLLPGDKQPKAFYGPMHQLTVKAPIAGDYGNERLLRLRLAPASREWNVEKL